MTNKSAPKIDSSAKQNAQSAEAGTASLETAESEIAIPHIARIHKKDGSLTPTKILQLQRTHGNRYVQRLIQEQRQVARTTAIQRVVAQDEATVPVLEPALQQQEDTHNTSPILEPSERQEEATDRSPVVTPAMALAAPVQRTLSTSGGGQIQRSFFGKLKSVLTNVGIALGKTVLGPFYEMIQYAVYLNSGKNSQSRNIELHPFKDVKKYIASEKGSERYGPGGQIPLFLRMLSSGIFKKLISWTSWVALWTGLLGMIPGAQALLAVSAATSSVALVMQFAKTAIDMVLNTWSGVTAWVRYMNLPLTGLKLADDNVRLYLEAYKEYKKTRGEAVDNALKLGTGAILGGAATDAAGKSFTEGATKAFTGVNPSDAFGTAMSNMATQSGADKAVSNVQDKMLAKEIANSATKEVAGNFGSWMGKGRLNVRDATKDTTKYENVGTANFKSSPNLQMLISNNLIDVQEGKTRKGTDAAFGGMRDELVGPPGESLKGMLGGLVNPLGGIVFLFFSIAKAIQKAKAAKKAVVTIGQKATTRTEKTEKHGKQLKVADGTLSEDAIIATAQDGGSIASQDSVASSVQTLPQKGSGVAQPDADGGGKVVAASQVANTANTVTQSVDAMESVEETATTIAESAEDLKEDFESKITESTAIASGSGKS